MNNLKLLRPKEAGNSSGIFRLSEREQEVLTLIIKGMTNKMIARELGICEGTVKVHVKNIMCKLDCGSRLEAAAIAINLDRNLQPIWGQE